jgi:hypothetical protein
MNPPSMHADFISSSAPSRVGRIGLASAEHEESDWAAFTSASDLGEYCRSWLAIQCRLIPGVLGAVVLTKLPGSEVLSLVASWPDERRDMSHLSDVAQQAVTQQRGVVLPQPALAAGAAARTFVGYPIESEGQSWAANRTANAGGLASIALGCLGPRIDGLPTSAGAIPTCAGTPAHGAGSARDCL